jgi:DNA primase (bacterial type)
LFQLGYALNEWEDTLVYLQGLGFSVEEMELAGLVVRREDGRVYDRFRGRLIIPIHDAQGRVVAFAGRVLDGGQPKYLNSPQTPIFDKGRTLYGYAQAVHAIRQEDRAVIVEGYMDVLSAHQAGYRNVVASMGTALTASHMRLLARHTQHIVLALDADAAGQKAALRGVEVAREGLERGARLTLTPIGALRYEATLEVDLRILQLPEGMDPDDLIRQAPERWKTLVEQALPVVDFYLQHFQETLDLDSAEGKAEMVRQMRPLLREIRSETVRYHYVQKLARMLRVDERLLATEVLGEVGARRRRPARRSSVGRREGSAPPPRPNVGTAQEMERHLMTMLLRNPEHLIWLGDDLKRLGQAEFSLEEFSDSRHRLILQGLLTGLIGGNLTETREILPELPEEVQEYTERLLEQARALPEVPEQVMRQKLVTALIWWRLLLNKEAAHQLRFLLEELPDDDEHVLMTYSIRLGNHLRAIYELERLLPALTMTH